MHQTLLRDLPEALLRTTARAWNLLFDAAPRGQRPSARTPSPVPARGGRTRPRLADDP